MPRRDELVTTSLRSRLRAWFAVHPGWHETSALYPHFDTITDDDIAADPARSSDRNRHRQDLRNEVKRLADAEDGVIRWRRPGAPAKGPGTKYARAGTPPPSP